MAKAATARRERLGRGAATAFVGLGSNLEHPRRQIARAVAALKRLPRTRVLAVSPNYASEPLETTTPQPEYVNAVVELATRLAPLALLRHLFVIERRQRRRRNPDERNAARTLDCDLLLYGRRRATLAPLQLPHPRMHRRAFVLRPLRDIAPAATIPGRGLARKHLPDVRTQRIARTRSHVLR
jgi:2-amino-4-hydroxy-6-hydroxymethyldihydropteridine diphosphokinase